MRILNFIFLLSVMFCKNILYASGGGEKKTESGHGGEAKSEGHGEKAEGHGGGAENDAKKKSETGSRGYVHEWTKFPKLKGTPLDQDTVTDFKFLDGYVGVVLFTASWCKSCQQITEQYLTLGKKYKNLSTQFVSVFSHDAKGDIDNFVREYNIAKEDALILDTETIREFHNPELPTIYIRDRRGWLTERYVRVTKKDLENLDDFLNKITAY